MAFIQKNFSTIGGQARSDVAPAHWSYQSATDALAVVQASDYFNAVATQLQAGDFINLVLTDGKFIATVESVAVSPTERIVVIDTDVIGSGGSTASRGALVLLDGNQATVTAVPFPIPFNLEDYDSDDIHDNSVNPNRLTVPPGVTHVKIIGQVQWQDSSAGSRQISITKNGITGFGGHALNLISPADAANDPATVHQAVSPVVEVVEGDYFEVMVTQNSGGNLNIIGAGAGSLTWASMKIVAGTAVGFGTAAFEDVGVDEGDVVQLEDVSGNPGLPAVDGSQLTNLPSGSGDVVGPAGVAADSNIAVYDSTTGKLIKDGGQTIAEVIAASAGTFKGAFVHSDSGNSVNTGVQFKVPWNQEGYDIGGWHDNSTNNTRLTVPAGVAKVRLTANIQWALNTNGVRRLFFLKNGLIANGLGEVIKDANANGVASFQNLSSAIINVVEGDYFEAVVTQDTGGSVNIESQNSAVSWFGIEAIADNGGQASNIWTLKETIVISNDADVQILNLTAKNYRLELFNLIPATDDVQFSAQVSINNGSSYATSKYQWAARVFAMSSGTNNNDNDGDDVSITFMGAAPNESVGNGGVAGFQYGLSGEVSLKNTSQSTFPLSLTHHINYQDDTGRGWFGHGGGMSVNDTQTIGTLNVNAVRLFFSMGNIVSGTVEVWESTA